MGCRDSLSDPVYRDGRWFDSVPDWWAWVQAGKPEEEEDPNV